MQDLYKQYQDGMDTSYYQEETEGYPFLAEVCVFLTGLTSKNLSSELREDLIDLNTTILIENYLFDDFSGYNNLFSYLKSYAIPVETWDNSKLVSCFLDNVESLCNNESFIDNLLNSLIKRVQEEYTAIEFATYYKQGLEILNSEEQPSEFDN